MNEPKITYARNPEGVLVHIDTVPNGLKCNCTCAGCGKPLTARQGDKNQHHFAHKGGNIRECYDKTLHSLAEQIIKDNKQVYSPKYEGDYYRHPSELLSFVDVEVEQRNDYPDLQPDLVGVTKDDKRIHIEIRNTHKVDANKEKKLRDREQICMEIDISKQNLDGLKEFLLEKDEDRKWISHPEFEEEERKAREAAFNFESAEIDEPYHEVTDDEMNGDIEWMSDSDIRTEGYGFDDEEEYYDEPVKQSSTEVQSTVPTEPHKVIEPPTIVRNEALDPVIKKLRAERVVKDIDGKTYYVEFCEQAFNSKYIVARVFDENYKTSHQSAHIVHINSLGYIYRDFGKESGESIYSWRYANARRK